jgi:hypothetical protein
MRKREEGVLREFVEKGRQRGFTKTNEGGETRKERVLPSS